MNLDGIVGYTKEKTKKLTLFCAINRNLSELLFRICHELKKSYLYFKYLRTYGTWYEGKNK